MLTFRQKLKLLGFSAGVLVTYTAFGILQEIIFRGRFGDKIAADGEHGERFELPISFRVLQCVFNGMFAKGSKVFDHSLVYIHCKLISAFTMTKNHQKNETHQGFYALIALFTCLSKITMNLSMQFVPYVTQVIGKGE